VTLFEKGGVKPPDHAVVAQGVGDVAQPPAPGTAVSDLQALDTNLDLYSDSDSDVLDDLQVQSDETANP
jgi:hypothetical protein